MKLRPYQQDCINTIVNRCYTEDNVLIQGATGVGKTIIFSALLEQVSSAHHFVRAIVLVPKIVLIEQTVEKLSNFINPLLIGVFNAKRKDIDTPYIVASWQSLKNLKDMPHCNMLIADEVHRFSKSQRDIHDRLKVVNPKIKLIGFTATPWTATKLIYGRDGLFANIHWKRTIKQMTPKYLVPIITGGSNDAPDLSNVRVTAGDYNEKDIDELMKAKVDSQVADAIKKTKDRKKVIFMCVTIEHAQMVHERIKGSGIIHSKTKDRAKVLDAFMYGDVKHIVSVLVLSEGFDSPCADTLVLMRPTRSTVLYVQGVGRIMRPFKGKENGLLLDYGRVVENLGYVEDINGPYQKSKDKVPPIKLCSICENHCPMNSTTCPTCGHMFMVMCPDCLTMIPYGEKCECYEQKQRDMLKNLTSTSWCAKPKELEPTWLEVHEFNVEYLQSKNGNWFFKLSFGSVVPLIMVMDWNRKLLSSFLDSYSNEMVNVDVLLKNPKLGYTIMAAGFQMPKQIKVQLKNKYWTLLGSKF